MNLPQVQYSTADQLDDLRFIVGRERCESRGGPYLIETANSLGLYDAADHIQRKFEAGERNWDRLLEW